VTDVRLRGALRFLPAVLWMGLLYGSSATPGLKSLPVVQRLGLLPTDLSPATADWAELLIRKTAHFGSYAVLALLLAWALGAFIERRRAAAAALAIAVAYAALDEWHQSFVPMRDGRWFDVVIDSAGAALAAWLWRRRKARA
jgi:VanZ family protein